MGEKERHGPRCAARCFYTQRDSITRSWAAYLKYYRETKKTQTGVKRRTEVGSVHRKVTLCMSVCACCYVWAYGKDILQSKKHKICVLKVRQV